MEWTDEHDVLMLRKMIVSDVFFFSRKEASAEEMRGIL